MSGKAKTDQEKAENTLAEMREAIREMHGLLKDVTQTKRDVADMIRKSRQEWEEEAQKFVSKELEELGLSLKKFIEDQREEIGKGFDKLYDELNASPEWAGDKTISQLIRESIKKVEREASVFAKASGFAKTVAEKEVLSK